MSGHSKWHTIKHKKGAADAKRGKIFTRIIKELTIAAKHGGGDPDMNPRLRTVIADAKAVNMPADNIKRAIRRGTGEEEGVQYDEILYEGYGPGGVALLVETMTDNRNRTVGEIRHILGKWGGKLGDPNSVARMFTKRGQIIVEKSKAEEEALMSAVLDAGADDMVDDGDAWEITSSPEAHPAVLEAVKALGIEPARLLKTLMAKAGDETVCVLAPSDRDVNLKKLASAAGAKSAAMMAAAEAERITGYHVGGISPFGQKKRVRVFVEQSALAFPKIVCNGGRRGLQVELAPADLVRVLGATSADLC